MLGDAKEAVLRAGFFETKSFDRATPPRVRHTAYSAAAAAIDQELRGIPPAIGGLLVPIVPIVTPTPATDSRDSRNRRTALQPAPPKVTYATTHAAENASSFITFVRSLVTAESGTDARRSAAKSSSSSRRPGVLRRKKRRDAIELRL